MPSGAEATLSDEMTINLAHRFIRIAVMALAVLLAAAGCASDPSGPDYGDDREPDLPSSTVRETRVAATGTEGVGPDPTIQTLAEPTSSADPARAITEDSTPTTASPPATEVIWSLPPGQASTILELMGVVESLRKREFLTRPPVAVGLRRDSATAASGIARNTPDESEVRPVLLESIRLSTGLHHLEDRWGSVGSEPFYDFDQQTIMLPDDGGPLDEYQKLVLVGELVHALTAQHNPEVFEGFGPRVEVPGGTTARRALVEGEGAVVQTLYLESLTAEQRSEAARLSSEYVGPLIDDLPRMLRDLIVFPHRAGSLFATSLYRLGGTAALDQALDRPPRSTEHILHLEKYRKLEPALAVPPLEVTVDGYALQEEGTWGEHRWRLLLSHYNDHAEAARAAVGWGGDRYELHSHMYTDDLILVARYVGDSFADDSEMNSALRTMLNSGVEAGGSLVADTVTEWNGADTYALLSWDLDAITLVISSDPIAGRTAAAQLGYTV